MCFTSACRCSDVSSSNGCRAAGEQGEVLSICCTLRHFPGRRWRGGGGDRAVTRSVAARAVRSIQRWAWLVVMLTAGRWVAKRGWPAASSTTGRVGRLWLAPGGGSMRHDSGGAKVVGRWRDSCTWLAAPDGHAA